MSVDNFKFCANEEMAIYILEFIKNGYDKSFDDSGKLKYIDALDMGIEALKKRVAQKPIVEISEEDEFGDKLIYWFCPECNAMLGCVGFEDRYMCSQRKACQNCQQLIDWSDEK